jgi:hypothetical protein
MALSAAANNVCANRIAQPQAAPSLHRQNSLDVYCNQNGQSHLNQPGVVGTIFSRPADVVSPPTSQHEVPNDSNFQQSRQLKDQIDDSLTAAHIKLQSDCSCFDINFFCLFVFYVGVLVQTRR